MLMWNRMLWDIRASVIGEMNITDWLAVRPEFTSGCIWCPRDLRQQQTWVAPVCPPIFDADGYSHFASAGPA